MYSWLCSLDIDECALPSNPCWQNCINTIGSFYCSCDDGFTLVDSVRCAGKENNLNSVFPFLNETEVVIKDRP